MCFCVFLPPPPPLSRIARAALEAVSGKAGNLALALFHEDEKYYSVRIVKDNGDDTFDIEWCEDDAEDTVNLADLRPNTKLFKKGDLVIAKCNEDGRKYTAVVQENNGKGSVTVQYVEDETEEEVLLDNMWSQKKKFKKGQKVEAQFPDDKEWYPATIKEMVGSGKYLVEWEDADGGDPESELVLDHIQIPRVALDTLEIGQKLRGEVKRVMDFGAFVDVGCYTDGLIHISKMDIGRVDNPHDYVEEDQELDVWVCSKDPEQNRLGLTMVEGKLGGGPRARREVVNPIADINVGDEYEGTVESIREFGAFVDIGAERAGLVHISRLAEGFVENPHDHVSEGQKVQVWVHSVDGDRLGLSMKRTGLVVPAGTQVEKLRADGDKRGEVLMLHKLATMSPYPDYALNTAQAAVELARKEGFAMEEKALKRTLTQLYAAKGNIDKAPNRREALLLLQDLARELERKDGDKFDDANKNLEGFWMALKQSDVDAAMQKVVSRDPVTYLQFLKEHGANVAVPGEKAAPPPGADVQGLGLQNKLLTGPKPYLYLSFRVGGISYGPRYRCCDLPMGVGGEPGSAVGVLALQDTSDDWERELQYNPSILDPLWIVLCRTALQACLWRTATFDIDSAELHLCIFRFPSQPPALRQGSGSVPALLSFRGLKSQYIDTMSLCLAWWQPLFKQEENPSKVGSRVALARSCVDECARLHFETRSREADEPECDPAGAVFQETLLGLPPRDQEGLLFAGTANLVALRWLLLLGANPKARDRNGTTLLHAACRSGSFLVAQELLRRELPLDATDSAGWTPLHVAAMMGRRELTQLLLQAQINPHVPNKRGATPLDLCSDVSTREALRTFAMKVPEVASSRINSIEEFQRLARVQGEVGEDPTATCEPFFVPRQPIFEDEAHYKVLVNIGLEMAHKSAAHALAFFVATGVVHDHPTDLSAFLIENKVNPSQLGEFMGEDFSLAQTLRLAFVHTMDLAGTGVVGALRKVFSYMRPPTELSKIDRITAAAAHLWWRTHDLDDAQPYLGMQEADEALEWTLFSEAAAYASHLHDFLLLWRKMPRVMLPLVSVHLPRVSHMVDLLWKLAKTNVEENMVFFSACDVSLLINGGFSPLTGFMKKADYDSVVENMRLTSGHLFGLPVVLDVADESLKGKKVLLTYQQAKLAVLEVDEIWKPDKVKEAKASYGTTSTEHPSVAELFSDLGKFYAGGKLHGLVTGFEMVWGKGFRTPKEVRASLPAGKQVVAFQNRNPVHKAHFELLVHANKDVENSIIFVHPTCGPTQPGDIDGPTRIKTYEVLQEEPEYKKWAGDNFRWSYLPYSMKMAGPREAIQHMIIRKNFGATHFIIGRDMAGTKSTLTSEDFYGAYEAQDMGKKHSAELSVKVVDYPNMVYVGQENGNERGYATDVDAKAKGVKINKLSGTEFRKRLRSGEEIPEWFAFPKVVKVAHLQLRTCKRQKPEVDRRVEAAEGEVVSPEQCSSGYRLLFSTVLLCWNIRRVLPDSEGGSNARLSFQEWLEVNSKIEADGTTPSVAVQKCIYNTLLQDECPELLPDASVKNAMPEFQEAPEDTSSALRAAGQVAGDTLNGWASIPPGGLERYDVPMPHGHQGGLSGAKLSHCVLSETSSSFLDRGHKNGINLLQPEVTAGEAVWMSLKYAVWLFFSTSPDDPAPYVFIRLQDTVLRETNLREKSIVLSGRMKKSADDDAAGPFGDSAREPLRLCFLLADGRFQLFEALWLELQLTSEEEMQMWARALSNACLAE
ncbi:MET3 [Symbiodinium natans]|uniref:sulfate adenylyltransferase n=1 Tax=Symbiodinium natans TaxID=878477 RepID=A0A812LZ24_9DINO|nr:MET3 [Symbiodinium natans]